jgi:RND family efflux transporter MFP subunit
MANAAKPIIRLEQMNPVKVIGSLVEKDLMLLNENETPATIHADSAKITFQGKVNKVYPAIVSKSRTGQFEILLDNPELKLRSGMYATINLFMKTEKDATVVSKDALLTHAGQYMAIKINNDGTAERVKLKLGIVQGDNAQVLEGLQPGDTIVSQSPELVKVGTKVRPIFSEAEK